MLSRQQLSKVFRSAIEASADPAMAAADWLASDIDPARSTVAELLTDPNISLDNLRKAKDVYKTMRILGETSMDRRIAANLYAAAIGAAFADHIVILRDGRIIGTLEPKGSGDAALVATGYQELAG